MAPSNFLIAMVRRYAIPCVAIIAVSLGSAAIAYKKQAPNDFFATCSLQVQIPLTKDQPKSNDSLTFNNRLAAHEIALAVSSGAYGAVAKAQKVDETDIMGRATTAPLLGLGTFAIKLTGFDQKKTVQLVNAVCDEIVKRVKTQRADEISQQVKAVQARMKPIEDALSKLEKKPRSKRTTQDRTDIAVQNSALQSNAVLIGSILSTPPDTIGVLSHAAAAKANDKRSKTRTGLIALSAGVLVCALLVLGSEAWRRRTQRG